MPFYSPYQQENVMNTLLNAYGAGQKIRKNIREEEMLKNAYNIYPDIEKSYDYDNSLLGGMFGTGLRNVYKGSDSNTPTNIESPKSEISTTDSINKLEVPQTDLKKELTKAASTKSVKSTTKTPAKSTSSNVLLDAIKPAPFVFVKGDNGISSYTPKSTEEMINDSMMPVGNNNVFKSSSLIDLLYGGK